MTEYLVKPYRCLCTITNLWNQNPDYKGAVRAFVFEQLPQVILMHSVRIKCYVIKYKMFIGKEPWVQMPVLILNTTPTLFPTFRKGEMPPISQVIPMRIKGDEAYKLFSIFSKHSMNSLNKHLLSTYTVLEDEEHLIKLLSINKYGNSVMVLREHITWGIHANQESLPEVS